MLWFLLFSLLPLGIVGYFSYSTASNALQDEVEEKLTRMGLHSIDKIDRILHERLSDVQVWSALELSKLAVQIGSGVGGASDFVNYLIKKYGVYRFILLFDREGICVTVNTINDANEPLQTEKVFLGKPFAEEPWFQEAMQGDSVVVTDWHQVSLLQQFAAQTSLPEESTYSMIFASAIRDFDGTVLGVWANILNWNVFQEILHQIQTELPGASNSMSSLLLLRDNDTIIAHSGLHARERGMFYGKKLSADLRQPQMVERLGQEKGVFSYRWDGKPQTIVLSREQGFERYAGKHWGYVMIADNAETYKPIFALRGKILTIGVISMLVILLLAYIIGSRFTAPLVSLSNSAAAISNGNLKQSIIVPESRNRHDGSRDEVDILIRSFVQMEENLRELIIQVQDAIQHITQTAEFMSAALQQLTTVSTEQSAAILETTSSMKEFVTTSREIAKSADHVAAFAEGTEHEAQTGVNAAMDTLARIQAIQQANTDNMEHVNALNERSKEIDDIVEFIDSIADTTDLIAFNAALEAAAAGEKGKRFGVVASEIRRLANTVATSIKDIKLKTADIQNVIRSLVSAYEAETGRIEKGVEDMKVTTSSFESILGKIEQTTASLMHISAATKEQQTSNEHVAAVLQNMSEETMRFQRIAQEALSITQELHTLAEELQQTVNVFSV